MRLLVAGFDGLAPDLVGRFRCETTYLNCLPSGAGIAGDTTLTLPIWTSMATGVRPTAHGVTAMWADEAARRPYCRSDVKARRFLWQLPNEYGYTVGWYRLPVTSYPPCALEGWMASGGATSPTAVWPLSLSADYDPGPASLWALQGLPIGRETRADIDSVCSRLWTAAREALSAELDSLLRLTRTAPVDVLFCYFNFTDTVQHHCFHSDTMLARLYGWVDGAVGQLTAHCQPEDMLVVSDHGMRAVNGQDDNARDVDGTWFVRSEMGEHAYYQSGVHILPGVLRSTFAVDGSLHPEDVFALVCLQCGIPPEELRGLDCRADCCGFGPKPDRVERQLRALGYL
jgi:hypothetical protein